MASKLESSIGDYLRQIRDYPLLTAAEERELGFRIQAAAESEQRLARGEITLAEHERIQREAAEARNRMIQANLRLVISVAKNFRNRGLPMEDLINEGNVGLVNAVDRYDPSIGSRFSTYASYWIDQAIRRSVQMSTQMIHIPGYLIEQIGHMRLAMRKLEERLNRAPTILELAAQMKISRRRAAAIVQALRACTCPNQATRGEDGTLLIDTIPDPLTPQPDDGVLDKSDADFVRKLLSRITEREAMVLKLRYGLSSQTGKTMTLKEVGTAVGLTRERVRQIEKEAKRKLEEYVRQYI